MYMQQCKLTLWILVYVPHFNTKIKKFQALHGLKMKPHFNREYYRQSCFADYMVWLNQHEEAA